MAVPWVRIAHRGFAAIAEENTLAAIEGALVRGCDAIELDVRRRADGRVVLHHDSADVPGVPLLADALALIGAVGAGVMLDLKGGGTAEVVARLLEEHAPGSRTIVSGNAAEVARVKRLRPSVIAGRTWPDRSAEGYPVLEHVANWPRRLRLPRLAAELLQGYDVLVAFHRVLSPAGVRACHDVGAAVYAWTVDDLRRIEQLRRYGVDGVISDDPASFGL